MVIIYIPFIFLGYGSDNDTFRILKAGDNFFQTFTYIPSRIPGCFIYEIFVYLIRHLGGFYLSNAMTIAIACLGVFSFYSLCFRFEIPHKELLTLIFIFHPLWLMNSTLTHDYVWSLSFSLFGLWLFLNNKYFVSALIWGISIGIRASAFIYPLVAIGFCLLLDRKNILKVLLNALIILIVTILLFLPSINFYQYSTKFFVYQFSQFPSRGFIFQTGVFLYRNIYFWGLPTILLLLISGISLLLKNSDNAIPFSFKSVFWFCLSVLIFEEILYWKYPFQVDYLLPILPVSLVLFSLLLNKKTKILWSLFIAVFISSLININIAQPDHSNHATQVIWGIWVEEGTLLKSIQDRIPLIHCDTLDCYQATTTASTFSLFLNK